MDQATWKQVLSSGEDSNLTVQVMKKQFRLHKFPMMLASGYFAGLLRSGMSDSTNVNLDSLPGGEETMELVVNFCYQQPISDRLTVKNIGHVQCAAHYLDIKDLTAVCTPLLQRFTNITILGRQTVLSNCSQILSRCADVVPIAESSGVTSPCILSLAQYWTSTTLIKPTGDGTAEPRKCWAGKQMMYTSGHHVVDPKVLSSWLDITSRVPVIWIGRIIEALSSDLPPSCLELPTLLTDMHLNYLESRGCLMFSEFDLLLKASAAAPARESYDLLFEVLERMLVQKDKGVPWLSDNQVIQIIQGMDFTKLSQEALERAVANERIPLKVTSRAILNVCSQLRAQLDEEKDKDEEKKREERKKKEMEMQELSKNIVGSWKMCNPTGCSYPDTGLPMTIRASPVSEDTLNLTIRKSVTTATVQQMYTLSLPDKCQQPVEYQSLLCNPSRNELWTHTRQSSASFYPNFLVQWKKN